MGIFSLLFRRNNIEAKDDTYNIETVETVSSKIEVVYHSGMRFKSIDSYIPNIDIMEVVVPIAMDIFKESYTVYFTERLLSNTLKDLELNLSLRKEIRLVSTGETTNLETFRSIAGSEISRLDISFLEKIVKSEIDIPTYIRIRQTLLESFKKAGESDPYFNEMHTIFSLRFLEYSDIEMVIKELSATETCTEFDLETVSDVLYINKPNSATPSMDIMHVASRNLSNYLSTIYNYNFVNLILARAINSLHNCIQEKLASYEDGISSVEYLSEIKKSIEEVDLNLIDLIRHKKIDETTYLTLQEVLIESFLVAKYYDLYMESISTVLNSHIDENKFFKEYISMKVYDMFNN